MARCFTWTWTELDLQGPENLVGCKRNVLFVGISSVDDIPCVCTHETFHAFKKAFHANIYS